MSVFVYACFFACLFGQNICRGGGFLVLLYRDSEEQKVTHLKAKSTALDDRKSPTFLQEVATQKMSFSRLNGKAA